MPDTKLNWANLREHLRKALPIYLAAVAAALFLANLLWLTTAPRIPGDRQVLIYLAGPWSNAEALDDLSADLLARGQEADPELLSVKFEGLLFADPARDYTGPMLLMTRLATGEGDAFLADPNAMDALVQSEACLPLDPYWEAGWLHDSGLEPYYASVTDEETGEERTLLAGLRIDSLDALQARTAFDNRSAFLAVAVNSDNPDTTLRVLEDMVNTLKEEPGHD